MVEIFDRRFVFCHYVCVYMCNYSNITWVQSARTEEHTVKKSPHLFRWTRLELGCTKNEVDVIDDFVVKNHHSVVLVSL